MIEKTNCDTLSISINTALWNKGIYVCHIIIVQEKVFVRKFVIT